MERIAHIAVIDDEDDFLTIFKFMFRSETTKGLYDLHYFHNGKEFADFIAENNKKEFFDLVLTDLNMPFMNGFELLKLAHQEIPYVPIFVLSAYGAEETKSKVINKGASEYFVKPIDFRKIKVKIKEYL